MKYDKLCQGCGHRIAMHIIDDIVREEKIEKKIILALDVACCSLIIDDAEYDSIMCPHGRVLPVTKGIKSIKNDSIVISYMGDGAAYTMGLSEMLNSAMKNENAFVIVINNGYLSMTGGQTCNTTIKGVKTTSSPYGKDEKIEGNAIKIEKLIKNFNISYMARAALNNEKNINDAYRYIKKALKKYINEGGFNLVELISPCPSNTKLTPKDTFKYIEDFILKYYEVGEFIC